jgi:hypothetical protein
VAARIYFLFASRDSLPFTWEAKRLVWSVVSSIKYLSHSLLGSFLEFWNFISFGDYFFFFNFLNSNSTTYIHIHTPSRISHSLSIYLLISPSYCVAYIDNYRACGGGGAQTGLQSRFLVFYPFSLSYSILLPRE